MSFPSFPLLSCWILMGCQGFLRPFQGLGAASFCRPAPAWTCWPSFGLQRRWFGVWGVLTRKSPERLLDKHGKYRWKERHLWSWKMLGIMAFWYSWRLLVYAMLQLSRWVFRYFLFWISHVASHKRQKSTARVAASWGISAERQCLQTSRQRRRADQA